MLTASMDRQTDFGGQPQPSEEQGVPPTWSMTPSLPYG